LDTIVSILPHILGIPKIDVHEFSFFNCYVAIRGMFGIIKRKGSDWFTAPARKV